MPFCVNCGNENSVGVRFCSKCGTEQVATLVGCSNCGKTLEENEKFCSGCGTPSASTVEPKVETKPKPESKAKKDNLTPEGRKIISGGPKPDQVKSQPTSPPSVAPTAKKKKKGCMGCLGKSLIGVFILLIVGVVIIWNLPEDEEEKLSDTNTPGIVDIESGSKPTKTTTKKYSKPNLKSKSTLVETIVNTDTTEVIIKVTDDISVILPIALLENEEKLVVKELKPVQLPNGQKSDIIIDVSLGNQHQFDDFIEILITPPSNFKPQSDYIQCLSMSSGDKSWQPVMAFYEPEINKIRMVTDHLTPFVLSVITHNGTVLVVDPMYTVATETYKYFRTIASNDAVSILEGYNTERVSKTLNKDYHVLSWNTVMDVYGLAGTGLSFMENGVGMSGLSKFGEAAGNIGIGLSVIQIALDAHNGKVKAAQVGIYKTFLNTVVSKGFNTRAMNLALIGVFAIDYSLTTFANEAWAGRKALYETIWDNYQQGQRKKKINLYWWKKQIVVGMRKANDPSKFESVVEGIITKYIEDFWNDETEIALIQSEVGPIFSAGGGLNKKMKEDLSADFRLQILQYTQSLLQSLQKQYIYKARKELSLQRAAFAKELNREQLIRCEVVLDKDEKPDKYEQLKVKFEVGGKEVIEMWQGVLNKEAKMDFYCTAAGYIGAGAPSNATLFIPDEMNDGKYNKIKSKINIAPSGKTTHVKFKNTPNKITYAEVEITFQGLLESVHPLEGTHKYKDECFWFMSSSLEKGKIVGNTISIAQEDNGLSLTFEDINNPVKLTGITLNDSDEELGSKISLSGLPLQFSSTKNDGYTTFTYKGNIAKYIDNLVYHSTFLRAKLTLLEYDPHGEIQVSIEYK